MHFDHEKIRQIVSKHYGFDCTVMSLDGDVDYNYKVQSEEGHIYILKICKPDVGQLQIEFQVALLQHLVENQLDLDIPKVITTKKGESFFSVSEDGQKHWVRMYSWVEGRLLAEIKPRTPALFRHWGMICGKLSQVLKTFDHPGAHRFDKWNPTEALHSKTYAKYFHDTEEQQLADYFWNLFESQALPKVKDLRHSVNYSDAHEHNLLVNEDHQNPRITGIIDFGDAIYGATICELAIACAYAGMYVPDPITAMVEVVSGYHSTFALMEEEVEVLFPLICGRLVVTVANAAYHIHERPADTYQQISAAPAWKLLRYLRRLSPNYVHYRFRSACQWYAHPHTLKFEKWIGQNNEDWTHPVRLTDSKVIPFDLSVGSPSLGNNANFESIERFCKKVEDMLWEESADIGIGGYGEIRPFYTTDAYQVEGNEGPQWRTMHLGVDYWTAAYTEVLAAWDGEVHAIKNNDNPCDYGPTIIVKHEADDFEFYTLYGHLSMPSLTQVQVGQKVKKGELIGWIGDKDVNGVWPPHLHFQIMLDLLDIEGDFPGVAFVDEAKVWLDICPSLPTVERPDVEARSSVKNQLLEYRKNVLGKSLSVSYDDPLHIVRGSGMYLYNATARRYLDLVNNVAHVGHEHPSVVGAGQKQMELLNTNTRYLHENIIHYAKALIDKCPESLNVVYFVNSGSEANELAIRMAKTYTQQQDIIALDVGYHGSTGTCIDVSSYKFDGQGGTGAPLHTTICEMPDTYRGRFKNMHTAGKSYAKEVETAVSQIQKEGRNVAGFIAESILSCGGQVLLPPEYLYHSYEVIRSAGGLCIADEVQVGFGRVGESFWGFELQGVVPDIITCGKPIGNGHPMAAVITTQKVADAFNNGMEYFNTFGGNPVSCAIGHEVLRVIEEENLQQNAKAVGAYFKEGLKQLQERYPIVGDVRGVGLFLGFELVLDRVKQTPAPNQATYLVNRMRKLGILLSTDGPLHNVIKIKPPMCISEDQVDQVLMRLDQVFKEDYMQYF